MSGDHSLKGVRKGWLPYGVLVATLGLTIIAGYNADAFHRARERVRFNHSVAEAQAGMDDGIRKYLALIDHVRGLGAAKLNMSGEQFRKYVEALGLQTNYPGIQGLGVGLRWSTAQKEEMVRRMHTAGQTNFAIWPESGEKELCPIIILEPRNERNRTMLGLDLLAQPMHRATMERAVETGAATASPKVPASAYATGPGETVFFICVPLFQSGMAPSSLEERRRDWKGMLYCPFEPSGFFKALLTQTRQLLDFKIFDGGELVLSNLLYETHGTLPQGSRPNQLAGTSTLAIAGRTWTLSASPTPVFAAASGLNLAPFILLGGTLLSFSLFVMTRTQIQARVEAENSALQLSKSEQALRASEQRHRLLFESSPQPMWMYDLEKLQILVVNDRAVRHYGYSREEFLRLRVTDIVLPSETGKNTSEESQPPTETGIQQHKKKDGRVISVEMTSTPMAVEGRAGRMVLANDVTERLRSEEARRSSEAKFRCLVEHSLVGIYAIAGNSFVYVNPTMARLFGYTIEEMIGAPVLNFIHEEDRPIVEGNIRRRLSGEVQTLHYGLRGVRKDGTVIELEALGSRTVFDGQIAILGTLLDVTERKRAEAEISTLNQELEHRVIERTAQLEAANKELESFSYSVSHDLRAPLRHIGSYVELGTEEAGEALNEKSRGYFKTVTNTVKEMRNLIDELLAFSRMGRVGLRRTMLNPQTLVEQTIRGLESEAKGRNIVWKHSPLPQVYGDPTLLKQVFVNLISNALKYSRPRDPAEIEIGLAGDEDGKAVLFVRDNGVGFDVKYADRLFGVFQRLHPASDFEGTGIGLANVQRIITRHGGRIWAEAAVDRGATFYFSIAKAKAEEQA